VFPSVLWQCCLNDWKDTCKNNTCHLSPEVSLSEQVEEVNGGGRPTEVHLENGDQGRQEIEVVSHGSHEFGLTCHELLE